MKSLLRERLPKVYDTGSKVKTSVVRALETKPGYDHDGMRLYGKSLDWLRDPRFVAAYRAGMTTKHHICRPKGSSADIHNEYRVYMCCWAATHASHLPGDFVECGVNTGITSVAICTYLDFDALDKKFYLFDTYCGIPLEQANDAELASRTAENASYYEECYDEAKASFSPWSNCRLVRGRIPESLAGQAIDQVAYLHLDMNIAAPEVAAIEHFWPRLVAGGIVMLDDYGFEQYRPQKLALDAWAARVGVMIATLPTGQGMILKFG